MAEFTPNLNLYKWQATDQKVITFSGYNDNADIIDAAIDELKNPESLWVDLILQNGVQAYTTGTSPRYSKEGVTLTLQGIVKNVTSFPTTIGTLPTGYRPIARSHIYIAPSGLDTGSVPTVTRITVNTDGTVVIEGKDGTAPNASTFFPINTIFKIS